MGGSDTSSPKVTLGILAARRQPGCVPHGDESGPLKHPNPEGDFPHGPVVRNSPCDAGDMDLIHGQGTRIPWAVGQLSLSTATIAPACSSKVPECCN